MDDIEDIDDSEISNLIIVTQSPIKPLGRPRARSREDAGDQQAQTGDLPPEVMKMINQGLYLYEQELRSGGASENGVEVV